MHEKLVKQLRNSEHCGGCPYDKDCNDFDSCLLDLLAADAIEDMSKRIARLEKELQETSTIGIEIDGLSLPESCFKCFAAHWYDYGGIVGYQCRAIPMDTKIISNCEARAKRRDDCPLKMKF